MKVKAPNGYCDGCVWARVEIRDELIFCPFVRCVRQTLAAIENNNVAKRKHTNKTR